MKKTLLIAAAVLLTFASCQKEGTSVTEQSDDLVFTATIAQNSKTTINATSGKVAWENGDKITITDAAQTSAQYEVSSIYTALTSGEQRARFTRVEGQPRLGAGPYTAVYGSEPATSQTYSATAPSLPMSAASETVILEFSVTCGLLELSLTAPQSVTSINVTGTPSGTSTTYTLTCNTAVDITGGGKFFIALPEGSYSTFQINCQSGASCKKAKSGESVTITKNHITPVTLKNLLFGTQLWDGSPYWATTNIGSSTPAGYGSYFAWGYPTGYTHNGTNWTDGNNTKTFDTTGFPDYYTHTYSDMAEACWGTGWRVPSKQDFQNLIANCTMTGNGSNGITFTGKGAYSGRSIYIPKAGYGWQDMKKDPSSCDSYYWTSTLDEEYPGSLAYVVYFDSGTETTNTIKADVKYMGCQVRPVRDTF